MLLAYSMAPNSKVLWENKMSGFLPEAFLSVELSDRSILFLLASSLEVWLVCSLKNNKSQFNHSSYVGLKSNNCQVDTYFLAVISQ